MKAAKKIYVAALLLFAFITATAQDQSYPRAALAGEARVTTYLQSGYDLGIYYYPNKSKLSFGALLASHQINGYTKEILFHSSNHRALDMRLHWIVSAITRYHFAQHTEGFFAEVGLGMEEFEVKQGNEIRANTNGFLAPSLGYIWYPRKRSGFYVLPKITFPIILAAPGEQRFSNDTSFQLKPIFYAPSLALGWKIDFKQHL